jgi:pilus assembly protein CpaC
LSSVPLLGNLFRSRTENKSKTELIVLVTPEVTSPLSATDPKPVIDFPKSFIPLPPAPKQSAAPGKSAPATSGTAGPKNDKKKGNGLRRLLTGGRGKTS